MKHVNLILPALLALSAPATSVPFSVKAPPDGFFAKPQFTTRYECAIRDADQGTVETFFDEIGANGFPCGVFAVECDWATYPGSMTFDSKAFPDPVALFGKIRGKGSLPLVSVSCFISPDSRQFRRFRYDPEGGGRDYILCGKDGKEPAIVKWKGGFSAVWDVGNPMAFGFFLDRLTSLSDRCKVEGFVFEALDEKKLSDCRFSSQGMTPSAFVRSYSRFARFFPASMHDGVLPDVTYVPIRLSARRHTWNDLKMIIPEMLERSREGTYYCVPDGVGGSDVSAIRPGREDHVDQNLFVRWCALQALMPVMQFARAPWRGLSPENVAICREFVRLHASLSPYILELVRNSVAREVPVVRSMDAVFPGKGFDRPLQQFMLGAKYLVAPVVSRDGSVTVEFPEGTWIDPRGMTIEGPKSLTLEKVPLSFLPYFERR